MSDPKIPTDALHVLNLAPCDCYYHARLRAKARMSDPNGSKNQFLRTPCVKIVVALLGCLSYPHLHFHLVIPSITLTVILLEERSENNLG